MRHTEQCLGQQPVTIMEMKVGEQILFKDNTRLKKKKKEAYMALESQVYGRNIPQFEKSPKMNFNK
jgi:hypothetical protein